jgi:hypothetical protein
MSKVYILVDERLMAAKNAKRSRHPRHFVVAAYSTMKNAQEAADGYLEALSFAPTGNGWKQGKLKGEITKTESSGKKSDKYGVLHSTYRDDEAVLGHLRILTLTVNQPPEDEIDYMTAETFGAEKYGTLEGDSPIEMNLTGLKMYQVGFNKFGEPLHRLDEEFIQQLKDNDFTFAMGDEYAEFGAEKITKKERAALPDSDFALPKERKYPIPDLEHGRLALTYTQWHKPEDDAEVARAVLKKYPSLKGWWKEHKNSENFYGAEQKGTTASGHKVEYDDGSFYMKFAEPIQGYDSVGGSWYGGDNELPDDIDLQVYHANEDYDNFEISISDVESYGVSQNKRNRWRLDNDSRGNGPDIFVDMSDELVEAIEEGLNWMLGDIERIMGVRYGAESVTNFKGEMKTLVQTYVELLYPDDSDMQAAIFENITSGKESVSLKEMQDYVATRSSWYAEIEAVNPSMAVIHNQNNDFVGSIEVLDDSDDPDSVEVFVNDDQMNEVSSTNLYEDGQFWEDYDAENFNAELEEEEFGEYFLDMDVYDDILSYALTGGNEFFLKGEEGGDYVEIFINDESVGETYVWWDKDMEQEVGGDCRYIIINNEMFHLNDLKEIDNARYGAEEHRFMIACGRCGWNFTDEYIKNNTDGNIRPMYGDHCSCGGMVKRYDFEPEAKPKGFFKKLFGKNAETFEAQLSFDRWSKDEMNEELHGGRDMNFEDWLEDEVHTHGNIPLKEWGDEEESESEHQHAEFNAAKGIDAYEEPFEEIGSFYSGNKGKAKIVGLGALVAAGIWITKNKLLE